MIAKKHPHLDHGYAVTSHSSQGQTAERVLVHVDTELGAKDLLNNRMAYVAVSRGAHDAQLFTNDREKVPLLSATMYPTRAPMHRRLTVEKGVTPQQDRAEARSSHSLESAEARTFGYGVSLRDSPP